MTMTRRFSTRSVLLAFAGAVGVAVGCSFGGNLADKKECGALGSHSELDETTDPAECSCDSGYDWCNPEDEDDFRCCTPDTECPDRNSHVELGDCVCDEGFDWCNPDDPADLSCCSTDGTGTGDGGTGTGDGSGDGGDNCGPGDLPPEEPCEDGASFWCTSVDPNCPGDFYSCEGGEWTLDTTMGDEDCMFNGDDFAYGCYDDADEATIFFVCGTGPGTACDDGDAANCADADVISECKFGRLSEDSCNRICTEEGDAGGSLFDFGSCGEQDGSFECLCCDFDDADCGDGGSTGTTGGTTTGGGSGTTATSGS